LTALLLMPAEQPVVQKSLNPVDQVPLSYDRLDLAGPAVPAAQARHNPVPQLTACFLHAGLPGPEYRVTRLQRGVRPRLQWIPTGSDGRSPRAPPDSSSVNC
jgi:hypothetical protein